MYFICQNLCLQSVLHCLRLARMLSELPFFSCLPVNVATTHILCRNIHIFRVFKPHLSLGRYADVTVKKCAVLLKPQRHVIDFTVGSFRLLFLSFTFVPPLQLILHKIVSLKCYAKYYSANNYFPRFIILLLHFEVAPISKVTLCTCYFWGNFSPCSVRW